MPGMIGLPELYGVAWSFGWSFLDCLELPVQLGVAWTAYRELLGLLEEAWTAWSCLDYLDLPGLLT